MGCGASSDKPAEVPAGERVPEGFPIAAERRLYICWDESCAANNVLMCSPKTTDEVVSVCNWAAEAGWKVRATGIKHNWSPITLQTVGADTSLNGYVLVSLMEHMTKVTVKPAEGDAPPLATVQLGCMQKDFLTALEKAPGGTGNIGYGMVHTPAPDEITIGGILAIDGHGTSIPIAAEHAHIDPKWANYGSYSNCMVACTAIVWDEATKKYAAREFRRERDEEIAPFLSHVGKAVLVDATLQVVPNYYMRCVSTLDIDWKEMFPATPADPMQPQERSMAWYMLKYGRAEAIWFPFTDTPWLKHWEVTDSMQPQGSTKVDGMTNYTFADDLGPNLTKFFRSLIGSDQDKQDELVREIKRQEEERYAGNEGKADKKNIAAKMTRWFEDVATDLADDSIEIVGGPKMTPLVNKCIKLRVCAGLLETDTDDIWGPSKNTLIYVRSTTLKVTANGYVVMTTLANVQECMHEFAHMYHALLEKFQKNNQYPIACPLEIRVTGVDKPGPIWVGAGKTTFTPPTCALTYDATAEQRGWDVALWLDVLSFPGTPHSNEFYCEMEEKLMAHPVFNGDKGRIRPEWSKGWGYSAKGPWTSESFRNHTRKGLPQWDAMMDAYAKHDPKGLYTNPWMDKFFVKVGSAGAAPAPAPAAAAAPAATAPKDDGAYDLRTRSAVVAQRTPIGVTVEAGKTYYWCTCGLSKNQPWCDGSHAGTEFKPMAWTAPESKEVYLCACKKTKNAPFCDGAHAKLPAEATAGVSSAALARLYGAKVHIKSHHGTYLKANADLVAIETATATSDTTQWTLVDAGEGKVAFKSHSSQYIRAHEGGQEGAKCDVVAEIGAWEQFTVEAHGGSYRFKTAHNTYLRAHNGATVDQQEAAKAAEWETWTFEPAGVMRLYNKKVTVKSSHGAFLTAEAGGEGSAVKQAAAAGESEAFVIDPIAGQPGKVNIKSAAHGTFVRAAPGGEGSKADLQTTAGEWEAWTLDVVNDDVVRFVSAHGTYLRAHAGGQDAAVDLQATAGDWEAWTLTLA